MTAEFLQKIDWTRPWLATLQPTAASIVQAADWRNALNDAITTLDVRNHRGLPIHFVPQSDLPTGTAYEAFISATGGVPTRDNLHDLFNALVWLSFPQIKVRLNALQAAEIAKSGVAPDKVEAGPMRRSKLRDGATIFDENAALLISRDAELVAALRAHRWHDVFMTGRTAFWRDCDVFLFGHALMEKLVTPYKAITAHAWIVFADGAFFTWTSTEKRAWIDATVARQLSKGLITSDFTPLPVLGIPGWRDGQNESFYRDTDVFRPKRMA